jgi:hypothetical protein
LINSRLPKIERSRGENDSQKNLLSEGVLMLKGGQGSGDRITKSIHKTSEASFTFVGTFHNFRIQMLKENSKAIFIRY